ncbi:hypothetical protein AB1282_03160 [Gottfriedia sp. S16(2024)]|uniref:hypothetical protein n=1 Tax=Bacillaceae TaxID=186817 RepID=UPI000AD5C09C|nr:hypothetical protein [Bacillus sp. FJAT-25509]
MGINLLKRRVKKATRLLAVSFKANGETDDLSFTTMVGHLLSVYVHNNFFIKERIGRK